MSDFWMRLAVIVGTLGFFYLIAWGSSRLDV